MTPSQNVLIVMDFQNGIVERIGSADALDAATRAVAAARAAQVPVFFVRVAFRPGYPEISPANQAFSRIADAAEDSMTEAHRATQVCDELLPRSDEPVITKRRVSAFAGSDLDVLLRAAGADHIVLAGVSTSGVVLSTVRQAADLDYGITVLEDACADPDPEVHRALMDKVFPRQAAIMSTDGWAKCLA